MCPRVELYAGVPTGDEAGGLSMITKVWMMLALALVLVLVMLISLSVMDLLAWVG